MGGLKGPTCGVGVGHSSCIHGGDLRPPGGRPRDRDGGLSHGIASLCLRLSRSQRQGGAPRRGRMAGGFICRVFWRCTLPVDILLDYTTVASSVAGKHQPSVGGAAFAHLEEGSPFKPHQGGHSFERFRGGSHRGRGFRLGKGGALGGFPGCSWGLFLRPLHMDGAQRAAAYDASDIYSALLQHGRRYTLGLRVRPAFRRQDTQRRAAFSPSRSCRSFWDTTPQLGRCGIFSANFVAVGLLGEPGEAACWLFYLKEGITVAKFAGGALILAGIYLALEENRHSFPITRLAKAAVRQQLKQPLHQVFLGCLQ